MLKYTEIDLHLATLKLIKGEYENGGRKRLRLMVSLRQDQETKASKEVDRVELAENR